MISQQARRCWQLIILIIYCSSSSHQQYRSLVVLSNSGSQFQPLNPQAQLLSTTLLPTFQSCALACNNHILCRVFDFAVNQSNQCRLFEGNINTLGSIVSSSLSSPTSNVGYVKITSDLFTDYGRSCLLNKIVSRYLTCGSSLTLECQPHSYWDNSSSMCLPQIPTLGGACTWGVNMCREDLNLTCLQIYKCGPISYMVGKTLLNNSTLTSDTGAPALTGVINIVTYQINGLSTILFGDVYLKQVVRFFDYGSSVNNITIVAKTWSGSDQLYEPYFVYIDTQNGYNMYVSDTIYARILLFSGMQSVSPLPQVVAGVSGSPGSGPYQINMPKGFAFDNQSRMYIAEMNNHRIMRWSANATYGELIAGNGTAGNGSLQLRWPRGIYIDKINDLLYVVDMGNSRVQRYSLSGSFPAVGTTIAGGNGAGSASNQLNSPESLWISPKTGAIYIADKSNHRIQRWDSNATRGITAAGSPTGTSGSDAYHLYSPQGVAIDANETYMYVCDSTNSRIQRFTLL
ncbi:hypothetical protein I4U23_005991 [Adineta vaga]|nr:hypothetical protein I4U23_005991 [Adineta vaga]